jgi:hypothetical protein
MIKQTLTRQQIEQAKANERLLPKKLKYDVSGNITVNRQAGCIGELACASYLGCELQHHYEYDIILNDWKIDVKTMKRGHDPQQNWVCRLPITGHMQDCDIYVFASVKHKNGIFAPYVHLCGWAFKFEVMQWPKVKKGDLWPESEGKTEKSDAYKSTYANLREMEDLG